MGAIDGQRYLGWLIVALSAVAWSTAGFFTRLIAEDVWTILFWRGVFAGLAIAVVTIIHYRRRTIEAYAGLGVPGLLLAVASTAGMITFLSALRLTTVADVYVIYATVPFVTAFIAWLALSEKATSGMLLGNPSRGNSFRSGK